MNMSPTQAQKRLEQATEPRLSYAHPTDRRPVRGAPGFAKAGHPNRVPKAKGAADSPRLSEVVRSDSILSIREDRPARFGMRHLI
jgi:hypothetical protein